MGYRIARAFLVLRTAWDYRKHRHDEIGIRVHYLWIYHMALVHWWTYTCPELISHDTWIEGKKAVDAQALNPTAEGYALLVMRTQELRPYFLQAHAEFYRRLRHYILVIGLIVLSIVALYFI